MGKTLKVFSIILVIIALALISTGSYMIYKNNNQENVKPTPTPTATPSSDNLDINDPLVQQLYNSLTIDYEHGCYMKPSDLNNNNSIRLRMAYSNLPDGTEKDTTCKEYDTKIKTNLSEYDYEYFCGPFAGDSSILGLSEEELKNEKTSYIEESALKEAYTKLFGSNYEYIPEDFVCVSGINIYHYIQEKQKYVLYALGSGDVCFYNKQEITKAYKENNKLYIETNYTEKTETKKVTYEFELENGNYVFVKVIESEK